MAFLKIIGITKDGEKIDLDDNLDIDYGYASHTCTIKIEDLPRKIVALEIEGGE